MNVDQAVEIRVLPVDDRRPRGSGAAWGVTALIGALLLWLYWPVLVSLVRQWSMDGNYSHGFLIPIMSAYLIWERRAALTRLEPAPNWWGAGVVVAGLAMFAVGHIGAELFLQRISLIIVLAGFVWLLGGTDLLRLWSFPLAFLVFMVPLPAILLNAVAFPLQGFAAQTAASCLVALNIPVLREGNVIALSRTTLEVAEACSGIRSLMTLLALGTAFAYFTERVFWKRVVIVLAAVPVAIVANAFRVTGTGVLAQYYGDEAAQGFYHDFSGWLVFVVACVMLFGVARLVSRLGRGATG
ncbi:exosortase A [Candidatus Nitrospira bockiana]